MMQLAFSVSCLSSSIDQPLVTDNKCLLGYIQMENVKKIHIKFNVYSYEKKRFNYSGALEVIGLIVVVCGLIVKKLVKWRACADSSLDKAVSFVSFLLTMCYAFLNLVLCVRQRIVT